MSDDDKKKLVKEKLGKLKSTLVNEVGRAMQRPKSAYGGPVRISSGIPMKFPYTFTAKIMQFPWKFYYRNNWIYRYYLFAVIVCIPVFKKISNMANTKENKEKWAEMRRKEAHEHH